MINKIVFLKFFFFAIALVGISSCINFDEWDNDRDDSPIYFSKDSPKNNIISTLIPSQESNLSNSNRLLDSQHEQALKKISFLVPESWLSIRDDYYASPSTTVVLHIITFQKGTPKSEIIDEYKQFISSSYDFHEEEYMGIEESIDDRDGIIGIYSGIKKEDASGWAGIIYTFESDSYSYIFMWDIDTSDDSKMDESTIDVQYIIDSISANKSQLISTSEECSQSNPSVANWLRETTPADSLSMSALQFASELYSNPRETGKLEALDWQKRTIEASVFMEEYSPVPQCFEAYHNLITEMLLQLSLTFSELNLVYVSLDADQDYMSHVNAAKQYLSNALETSVASVDEWDRLKDLGLPRP